MQNLLSQVGTNTDNRNAAEVFVVVVVCELYIFLKKIILCINVFLITNIWRIAKDNAVKMILEHSVEEIVSYFLFRNLGFLKK